MTKRKNIFIRLFILSLNLVLSAHMSAAPELPPGKPLLQSFSMVADRGLAQNWAVEQGPDGLIYVGGGSSLLIFDGVIWRSIETPDDGRVRDLKIDHQGRIWIASPGEFGYFSRDHQGHLNYHSISQKLPDNLRDFGETRFVQVLGDAVYFNTHEQLFRWANGQLGSFDKWDGLFRLTFVANGRYYAVVKNRVYDFTDFPETGSQPSPEGKWRWPEKAKITFLSEWDDGQLLLGTYDDGLYILGDDKPVRFNNDATVLSAWPYSALRMADGSVVVTSIQSGILHLSQEGKLLEHIDTNLGLPVNSTLGAAMDQSGGLWLAQEGAITRVELDYSLRVYDKQNNVAQTRAVVDFSGHLLVGGLPALGVLEANAGITNLRQLDVPLAQETFDLLTTDQGLMLSGFNGIHLLQFDPNITRVESAQNLYEDTYTYGMFPSRFRDVIYVESENGIGVLVLDGEDWIALPRVPGINQRPSTFAEDSQGRVWVGSGDGKYRRFSWSNDRALELDTTLGPEQGVPEGNAHVFNLGERLIFGTTQGGFRLTHDGSRIEPDPLFGNEQLAIDQKDLFDFYTSDQTNIMAVIGAKKEIWRAQLQVDGTIQWYGPQLLQMDPGDINSLTEVQKTLWIGQATKLLRLDWPAAEPLTTAKEHLNLRWVGFLDRQNSEQQVLLNGIFNTQTQPLEPLPYNPEALRFEYALASYAKPEKTRYRVWLEGHDKDWSRWSAESRRDYTNLPGGNYHFKVQAKNVFGTVTESPPFTFSVKPPWYFSKIAWLLWVTCGLILLWLSAWLGRLRKQQRLINTQHQLEAEVANRTAQVRQQAKELRELSEAKSRFFANVSHEFRTPLTLVKGPLEELVRGEAGKLNDEASRFIKIALRNTETLQGLIGQILDINRLEAGQMPISVTRDDIAAHVKESAAEFEAQANQQGILLAVHGCETPIDVDFDPSHLTTILRNLLANALKFTAQGGHVDVYCKDAGGSVELIVSDSGCGISPNDLPHVFERYYQGDQTHASQPGTGIGLALVKELAQLHRGTVDASSIEGEGTSISVCLPSELPELRKPVLVHEHVDGSDVHFGQDHDSQLIDFDDANVPAILIVDDNPELRAFLNYRLQGSYRILEAGNGVEGLKLAKSELPDIIVTDVMMPKMTGLEMTSALRADPDTDFIPILMLSARTTRRDTVAGLQQGADDYLAKPFDSAELAARVAGLIASRRKLQARMQIQDEADKRQSVFLENAAGIAHKHLAEADFGPRDWAALLHMDRTTLYRKLKAETGLSPEEYLREQRLLLAADLLKTKAGNVSQVAVSVGFNSISYFSTRFKERFGLTPAAYTRN